MINICQSLISGIQTWLDVQMKIKIKESTYYNYQQRIDVYIKPNFVDMKISDIEANDLQAFMMRLKNRKTGKPLSSQTLRGILSLLSDFFEYCIRANVIENNPCKLISVPTRKYEKIAVLTLKEQQKIYESVVREHTSRSLLVLTALFTGMRVGELCSLQWSKLDLKEKQIHVEVTQQRIQRKVSNSQKTVVITDLPKTRNSFRRVPISDFLFRELLALKRRTPILNEYVFYKSNGDRYDIRSIQKYFEKLTEKELGERKNFHALRHTFATRAIESNMDIKTLSVLLGHGNVNTTLNLYVHPNEAHTRKSMDILSQYMRFHEK